MNASNIVKELLDIINQRFVISIVLNVMMYLGFSWWSWHLIDQLRISNSMKIFARVVVIVGFIVILTGLIVAILDVSDAVDALKRYYDAVIYDSGIKSV